MRNLVLLWWNSIRNQQWIKNVEEQLRPFFDTTYIDEYQHRKIGTWDMDMQKEIALLSSYIKNRQETVIFAKSAWTILTIKTMTKIWKNPQKCIFVWLPLVNVKKNWFSINSYIQKISCPILFIQNKNDPMGSFQEIINEVEWRPDFSFRELPGDDHQYDDVKALRDILISFLW